MDFWGFIISIVLGFLLSGIWFGFCFIIGALISKLKILWLLYLNSVLGSIIPTLFIAATMGLYPIQINGMQNKRVYFAAIVTVVITTAVITRKKSKKCRKGKDLLIWGLDGILMEIPQRLMMQSFVYGILKLLGVSSINFYTIIATALIWCMGIGMQTVLAKKPLDGDLFFDILSSFIFSLGIGYVYQQTGLIVITMMAHFSERVLSSSFLRKRFS